MSEMTDTAAPREPGWYWCRWGMHNDTEHWRPCYWSGAWEVPNVQRKLPDSAWAEIGPRIYPPGQDAAQRVIEAAYAWWREEWGCEKDPEELNARRIDQGFPPISNEEVELMRALAEQKEPK